jgi:hypothetical protein
VAISYRQLNSILIIVLCCTPLYSHSSDSLSSTKILLQLLNSQFQFSNPPRCTQTLVIQTRVGPHGKHVSRVRMRGADRIENTSSVVRMRVYWPVTQHWAWRGPHIKHFFQYPFSCFVHVSGVAQKWVYMSQYFLFYLAESESVTKSDYVTE